MKTIATSLILAFALLLAGCGRTEYHHPQELTIIGGESQTCIAGEECQEMLNIRVLSSRERPAVGVKVRVTSMLDGAVATPDEGTSDSGGNFRCRLRLAKKFGDQYFKVECPDFGDVKPIYVHAIAGVTVMGNNQETNAGDGLVNPIRITVTDEEGKVKAGVPVFFSFKSAPRGASLTSHRLETDDNGNVNLGLQTAKGVTAKYEIIAEVGDGNARTRGIVIQALAISKGTLFAGVIGGLGLFIFGMMMMSDGLQQLAGERLKGLLQLFTGNRLKAMMAGLVVTSLIQSSGACTVMVVGFVNAALLTLNQAIGIILGASIGTTVTAQMVSFKLEGLALPAIALGVLFTLLAKRNQTKGVASTILGFGLLFYGMTIMSTQLKAVSEFPTFVAFFHKFDCTPEPGQMMPFWNICGAILVGVVMTIIVQSSSATVSFAIALAESGLLNYYTAIPLILGDNLGSAATGLLGSINANKTSRQAAVSQVVFKFLSLLLALPFFYITWNGRPWLLELVNFLTAGNVFAQIPENIGRHLASAHTLFNVITVFLFLPFVNFLAKISRLLVPDGNEAADDSVIYRLEKRLLNTPSAALSQVFMALIAMTEAATKLTHRVVAAVTEEEAPISQDEVNRLEGRIDEAQHSTIDYLVMLTRRNLNVSQSSIIPVFMHCVNDAERIGDRAVNIYELVPNLSNKETFFSGSAQSEIASISQVLDQMVSTLLQGLRRNDPNAIQKVFAMDHEVKRMTDLYEHNHEARLRVKDCTVEKGVIFVELLANLERISAHITNIAERAKDMLSHSVTFLGNAESEKQP